MINRENPVALMCEAEPCPPDGDRDDHAEPPSRGSCRQAVAQPGSATRKRIPANGGAAAGKSSKRPVDPEHAQSSGNEHYDEEDVVVDEYEARVAAEEGDRGR